MDILDTKETLPTDSDIINAYMMYVALGASTNQYFCVKCGHFPTVMMFDLCKNTVFNMAGMTISNC